MNYARVLDVVRLSEIIFREKLLSDYKLEYFEMVFEIWHL